MTNEMIIFNERVSLMNEGIIKGTGRYITAVNSDGEKVQLEEPEELHTYAGWKALNRQVRRGEKSVSTLMIWKHSRKCLEGEEEEQERVFKTKAFFFTESQTEPVIE